MKKITKNHFDKYGNFVGISKRHDYAKNKVKASITFADVKRKYYAEYSLKFETGDCVSSTMPLTSFGVGFDTVEAAVADCAARMLADLLAKCPASKKMPALQQRSLKELIKWIEQWLAATPQPPVGRDLEDKTYSELFAGIGGFGVALDALGAKAVFVCEKDKAARETYVANFGDQVPFHDDITTLNAKKVPASQNIVGGFPCQSFSVAGKMDGLAAPTKGALFFDFARIVKEKRPELVIVENVSNLATHDDGATSDIVIKTFSEMGYAVSMQRLNSANFGVPQARERTFIVCHRMDIFRKQNKPFVFPVGDDATKTVADILESNVKTGVCKSKMTPNINSASKTEGVIQLGIVAKKNGTTDSHQGYRVYSIAGKGITLCASSGGPGANSGLYNTAGKINRRLSLRECARMTGFPDSFIPHKTATQAYKQFGNSVVVSVVTAIAKAAAKFI